MLSQSTQDTSTLNLENQDAKRRGLRSRVARKVLPSSLQQHLRAATMTPSSNKTATTENVVRAILQEPWVMLTELFILESFARALQKMCVF